MAKKAKRKTASQPPLSDNELISMLIVAMLEGAQPTAVVETLIACERAGKTVPREAVQGWAERLASREDVGAKDCWKAYRLAGSGRLDSLAPEDLLAGAFTASAREQDSPPADPAAYSDVDWTEIEADARWALLDEAVRTAAIASNVAIGLEEAREALELLLVHALPSLLPSPLERLRWWANAVAELEAEGMDGVNYGDGPGAEVGNWADEASRSGDLGELLALVEVLRELPSFGCVVAHESLLIQGSSALREALPSKTPRKKRKARSKD